MDKSENLADGKIRDFLKTALRFFDTEIELKSGQLFSFEQVVDFEKEQTGEFQFTIQYGFPQSGAVFLNFTFWPKQKKVNVNSVCVDAPDKDKELVIANIATNVNDSEMGVSFKTGLDGNTKPHNSVEEINQNPNAIKMLDLATSDLNQANILGPCMISAAEGSKTIPRCDASHVSPSRH